MEYCFSIEGTKEYNAYTKIFDLKNSCSLSKLIRYGSNKSGMLIMLYKIQKVDTLARTKRRHYYYKILMYVTNIKGHSKS